MSRIRKDTEAPAWVQDEPEPRPMYRELPERKLEDSSPDDVCPECGKKIREHIAEFRRYGERVSQRVVKL